MIDDKEALQICIQTMHRLWCDHYFNDFRFDPTIEFDFTTNEFFEYVDGHNVPLKVDPKSNAYLLPYRKSLPITRIVEYVSKLEKSIINAHLLDEQQFHKFQNNLEHLKSQLTNTKS